MIHGEASMTHEIPLPKVPAGIRGSPPRHRVQAAAASWEPGSWCFRADWDRALMLHYEVPAAKLQPFVPFELDVRDGWAYVSLVAFTMRGLRPRPPDPTHEAPPRRRGIREGLLTLLLAPIATHEFLNVRTYVRHGGECGIYFLAEWLPNVLSVPLGRPVFGLPYRLGRTTYLHEHERGVLFGEVRAAKGRGVLRYRAAAGKEFRGCAPGSLSEWLMERYTAFTEWRGWKRLFRVRHEPWRQCPVEVEILDDSLLAQCGGWSRFARFIGANYSPGLRDVAMSAPRTLQFPRFTRHRPFTQS